MTEGLEKLEKALELFGPVPASLMDDLPRYFNLAMLARNEFMIREGDVSKQIAFLEQGMLRYYYAKASGEEITRWIGIEGSFNTSLSSLICQQPSKEYIQAVKDCKLWLISWNDFQLLRAKHEWLERFWTKMLEFEIVRFEGRVRDLITSSADEAYDRISQLFPEVVEQAPLQYVASMLGISPQHLSRIRGQRAKNRS